MDSFAQGWWSDVGQNVLNNLNNQKVNNVSNILPLTDIILLSLLLEVSVSPKNNTTSEFHRLLQNNPQKDDTSICSSSAFPSGRRVFIGAWGGRGGGLLITWRLGNMWG